MEQLQPNPLVEITVEEFKELRNELTIIADRLEALILLYGRMPLKSATNFMS
jgi:hypothetical protein